MSTESDFDWDATMKRNSEERAARRAALIAKHGSVEAVTELTAYELSVISRVSDYLGADDRSLNLSDLAECVSVLMIDTPPSIEGISREASMLEQREEDLCAVLDVELMNGDPNPLHPAVAVRKTVLGQVALAGHGWRAAR